MAITEWHAQGAPDSDEVASESFLAELAAAISSRVPEVSSKKAKGPKLFSIDPSIGVVIEDEGYDCRIGDRARKRRREAHTVAETRQKAGDVKGAGETSNSSGVPPGTKSPLVSSVCKSMQANLDLRRSIRLSHLLLFINRWQAKEGKRLDRETSRPTSQAVGSKQAVQGHSDQVRQGQQGQDNWRPTYTNKA